MRVSSRVKTENPIVQSHLRAKIMQPTCVYFDKVLRVAFYIYDTVMMMCVSRGSSSCLFYAGLPGLFSGPEEVSNNFPPLLYRSYSPPPSS